MVFSNCSNVYTSVSVLSTSLCPLPVSSLTPSLSSLHLCPLSLTICPLSLILCPLSPPPPPPPYAFPCTRASKLNQQICVAFSLIFTRETPPIYFGFMLCIKQEWLYLPFRLWPIVISLLSGYQMDSRESWTRRARWFSQVIQLRRWTPIWNSIRIASIRFIYLTLFCGACNRA